MLTGAVHVFAQNSQSIFFNQLEAFTSNLPNLEPVDYKYDFFSPFDCSLLCKNGKQHTTDIVNLNNPGASNIYEGSNIDYSGVIEDESSIFILSQNKIELTSGFEAAAGSRFDAEILYGCPNESNYITASDNRYNMSVFGPRMMTSGNNMAKSFDFHQGNDMVDHKIRSNTEIHPIINCMCDGEIVDIYNEEDTPNLEATDKGRSVTVMCDSSFAVSEWGPVFLAFRHLDSIFYDRIYVGAQIHKDEPIGIMGSSGVTSNNHLHLSVQRRECKQNFQGCDIKDSKKVYRFNVHPDRVFNKEFNKHLVKELDDSGAGFWLLSYDNGIETGDMGCSGIGSFINAETTGNWALMRFAIPYNQVSLRAITIKVEGTGYSKTYDFEEVSGSIEDTLSSGSQIINGEDYNYVAGLKVFAFPFNRYQSAYSYFHNNEGAINALASHTGKCFPIPNSGVFTKSTYVLDILANDLPYFETGDLVIEAVDIWGNGLRAKIAEEVFRGANPAVNHIRFDKTASFAAVEVFPNPVTGNEFFIQLDDHLMGDDDQINGAIINMLGVEVKPFELDNRPGIKQKINITELPNGTYVLKLSINKEFISSSMIIHH